MPFTLSHTAIVLPFTRPLRRWRLLSAALIGSMVPDFGLFFPWRLPRFETHSALALLTFCLPVGLVCYWAFQFVLKAPVLEVLPEGAVTRAGVRFPRPRNSRTSANGYWLRAEYWRERRHTSCGTRSLMKAHAVCA